VNTVPAGTSAGAEPGLVADTQVVLDWLVFRDAAARPLLEAVLAGRLRWLATPTMRGELQHMLQHPSLARWGHDAGRALEFFDRQAALWPDPVMPFAPRLACSDPDDQVFIDTALAHRATWLVTRDRALLKLRRKAQRCGLCIVRPGEWPGAPAPP
jgi:predicted nucleic acid-binding protein